MVKKMGNFGLNIRSTSPNSGHTAIVLRTSIYAQIRQNRTSYVCHTLYVIDRLIGINFGGD